MLKIRLIPCLDVKDGRVVKGVNFVNLKDAGDPVQIAKIYEEAGADELCFLDITASSQKRGTILETVRQVARHCFMPLSVGGGVRRIEDVQALLSAGADKVAINTAAIENPSLLEQASKSFGAQAVICALDAKRITNNHFELFTYGGRQATGMNAVDFAKKAQALGAGEILLTSMDRDGTKSGFDCALTKAVAQAVSIPVIASGGAGALSHFVDIVKQGEASAVLAASLFHFGELSIGQTKDFMKKHGVAVRYKG